MKTLPILISAALLLVSCKGGNKADENQVGSKLQYAKQNSEVEIVTLKRENFEYQLLSNGKLYAAKRASLQFGTAGIISSINVSNGQAVGRGTVIARLDSKAQKLSADAARIALQKSELDMYDFLVGLGYKARDTVSVPKDILRTAKMQAGYASARNAYFIAKQELAGAVLISPFRGRVSDIKQRCYEPASGIFCTVADDSRLDVDFSVMESEYSFLQKNLGVIISPFNSTSKKLKGRIISVNPSVDSNGQILVRAEVANDGSLIDGMDVKVIVEKTVPNQLTVPKSAIVVRDNLNVLFTYSNDGKAHWVYVNVIASNEDSCIVEANKERGAELNEGDAVIISGNLNLADNSSVVLKK